MEIKFNSDCEIQNIIHDFDFRKHFQIMEGKTEIEISKEDKLELKRWNAAIKEAEILELPVLNQENT